VLRRHPWIFVGSIASTADTEGNGTPGQIVKVLDARGNFLAWGAISPKSNIRVRIWSWDEREEIGPIFFQQRLKKSIDLRKNLRQNEHTNAYRLVHAESDGIPGLIIDQYDQTLVVQFLTCGVEFWRDTILSQLVAITGCSQIYDRSDVEVRLLEGMAQTKSLVYGDILANPVEIYEGELKYLVDIVGGQKTGFFLDQRHNRHAVRGLAADKSVLDCFAYTGGFTIAALQGGAKDVTALEASSAAVQMASKNMLLNQLPENSVNFEETDVFKYLRQLRDRGRTYDMVILDPPKFAPTSAHAQKAARGYKDINLLAFKLLKPGGLLVTFSCSGGVSTDLFQKIVAGAALDAGVMGRIIYRLGPGADHPVAINFPEGEYLKGLVIQI
jgi:23S rRNA (cytosine1962-C5)-methyltransferase